MKVKSNKIGAPRKFKEPMVDRIFVLVPPSTREALKLKAAELGVSVGELSRMAFELIIHS